jgi:hypothetical protein
MSGLLKNYGGFFAQGTEILGKGVSEEKTTFGTIVTAGGISDTPANITKKISTAGGVNNALTR